MELRTAKKGPNRVRRPAGYKRLQIDRESHYKGLIKGLRAKDVKGFPARIKESSQRK
jgi:hypothetical protein